MAALTDAEADAVAVFVLLAMVAVVVSVAAERLAVARLVRRYRLRDQPRRARQRG